MAIYEKNNEDIKDDSSENRSGDNQDKCAEEEKSEEPRSQFKLSGVEVNEFVEENEQ